MPADSGPPTPWMTRRPRSMMPLTSSIQLGGSTPGLLAVTWSASARDSTSPARTAFEYSPNERNCARGCTGSAVNARASMLATVSRTCAIASRASVSTETTSVSTIVSDIGSLSSSLIADTPAVAYAGYGVRLTSRSPALMCCTASRVFVQADLIGLNPTDNPRLAPVRARVAASRPSVVLTISKSM